MPVAAGVVQVLHGLGYGLDNWASVGLLHGQAISLFSSVQSKFRAHAASYSLSKKGKAVPLLSWSGPEGSRMLRFPDYMTKAQ